MQRAPVQKSPYLKMTTTLIARFPAADVPNPPDLAVVGTLETRNPNLTWTS